MFGQNNSARAHQWVEERLSEYVDNRLSPRERVTIEQHLADCATCRASLESLRWTIALVKQVPAPALPRSFTLPMPAPRAQRVSLAFGLAQFGAALATLLLLAVIGVDVLMQWSGVTGAPMPSAASEFAEPTLAIAAAPPTPARDQAGALRAEPTQPPAPTRAPQPTLIAPAVAPLAPQPSATIDWQAEKARSATPPRIGVAAISPTATSTPTIAATPVPPTATATLVPSPTWIAQARDERARAPQPTPIPRVVTPFDTNLLRTLEVILFVLALFFGAIVLVMWKRR
ncbi:MAG: zf-HC2 domain-containing protein [Anaerolineae bacterium]|nr:zf-HC2 domain-containing protein [Anaerolineae bacterium]